MSKYDILEALKNAAVRTDDAVVKYGVDMKWSLNFVGLRLEARVDGDRVEKYITWHELADAHSIDVLLHNAEDAALMGLST